MKKIQLIILAALIATGIFAGCTPNKTEDAQPSDEPLPQTQQIKAVIQEVHEGQLLVVPIEGLDDIDIIYLNYNDDVIMNISDSAPLELGNIVTAIIGTEIMESYPPQVHLYEIVGTEPGDSTGDTQLMPDEYIIGKVISISGNTYKIEVISANLYKGEMSITIPDSVLKADMPIKPGFQVGVYIAAEDDIITAEWLVFSEPDTTVKLDDRETVSSYLDGLFPQAIYTMADEKLSAQAGIPFAIALDENCESEWEMTSQSGVTLEADGISETKEDGSYTHYFGISIAQAGEYEITFINHTADGDFDYTFTVSVK